MKGRAHGARLIALRHQLVRQFIVALNHTSVTPGLDASAVRIINQEKVGLRIIREIAKCDVLLIAGKIGYECAPTAS